MLPINLATDFNPRYFTNELGSTLVSVLANCLVALANGFYFASASDLC